MKKLFIIATFISLISCKESSDTSSKIITGDKEITLEEIWNGTFSPKRMNALNSMNGDFYSLLNSDENGNTTVDKYSYETLEKVETIVNSKASMIKEKVFGGVTVVDSTDDCESCQ